MGRVGEKYVLGSRVLAVAKFTVFWRTSSEHADFDIDLNVETLDIGPFSNILRTQCVFTI